MASPASTASRSHDSGEAAPSGSGSPSARAAAEIVALTTRDEFLLELGEALSGQASIRPVDSIDSAIESLNQSRVRAQVLVIDSVETANLRADVERAQANSPQATILVFAPADAEKQTAAALKGTGTFAVLPAPIDKRKTAAVFEGAVADATARYSRYGTPSRASGSGISVEPASIGMERPEAGHGDSGGDSKRTMIIGGGVALVLAIAVGAWFMMRGGEAPTPAAPSASASDSAQEAAEPEAEEVAPVTPNVADVPLVQGTVDELLEKARLAMRERRYTEPSGDNALLYYRSAAAADPNNGEAIDGLGRVAAVLASRFDESMAAGEYDDAALALANLKVAKPGGSDIAARELKLATAQINKALNDGNLDRAAALVRGAQQSGSVPAEQITKWRAEINRRQDEYRQRRAADLFADSIRDGRLTEPANNSARHYLEQMRDAGASSSVIQRMTRELNNAYMRKAREALLANNRAEADRWIAEARAGGVSSNEINALQRDVAAARQRAAAAEADRFAQLARERISQGRLTEPANDSAAHYLTQLQSADKDNPAIATTSRELATKLIERARTAAREGKTAQVEADLAAARKWGATEKEIQSVQQGSSVARTPSSSGGSASSSRQQPSIEALQAKLKRVRYAAPEFPERALQQRISGSVTVEFVVATNGETTDVRVVESDPAGVFDRAAIAAVRRWRYEPVIVDNVPREVPARTVIRFALPD
ncbi:MAG TPA: energy transducer TonB [Steroidobacteraceae bacterium]